MNVVNALPPLAAVFFLAFAAFRVGSSGVSRRNVWLVPAGLLVAFLLFSAGAMVVEGPLAFWREHTRNLWGNQIWLDLLLAVAIAWYFLVPQAKAVDMRLAPWLALVACTGSVGLLAMVSRLLFLRSKHNNV